jgi:hypothetical protein
VLGIWQDAVAEGSGFRVQQRRHRSFFLNPKP